MLSTLLAALTLIAAPQAPPTPPLIEHRFSTGVEGWQAFGEIARADTTTDGDKPALRFEYTVDKRFLGGLMLPVSEPAKLAAAQAITFSVKPSHATALGIVIQEDGGGRFVAIFHAPAGAWQKVALAPSDFLLARDPGDPADANGKLDREKIQAISLFDLAQIFVKGDENTVRLLFSLTPGPRTLLLSEFAVRAEALPGKPGYDFDGLSRPQVGWIGVGGVKLARTTAGPLTGSALEASYQIAPGKIAGIARGLPGALLGSAKNLVFRAAALKASTLVVQLEDDRGGKYQTTISLPGLKTPRDLSLPLADFKPTDDNKGPATLEPARVKQLVVMDAGGLLEGVDQENTLWLAGLGAR